MFRFLFGVFVVLHGLVHLWYVTLSQRLVEFQPAMGWTGESWVFRALLDDGITRSLASVLYVMAALGFVAGGIGVLAQQAWWRPVTVGSAAFSAAIIILFWDGRIQMPVEKGLLGLLINLALLVALLIFGQPTAEF
jgi:hypothetical protein